MGSPNATVYRFRGVGLIFDHPSPFVPTRRNVALRGDIHTVRMLYRITILREGLAKLVHVNETPERGCTYCVCRLLRRGHQCASCAAAAADQQEQMLEVVERAQEDLQRIGVETALCLPAGDADPELLVVGGD